MNLTYIIVQEGVYRHEIHGPHAELEQAKAEAERLANEGDGYHVFAVLCSSEVGRKPFYEVGQWSRCHTYPRPEQAQWIPKL